MNHLYQIRQINIKQKHNNQDQLSIFWILPGTTFSDTLSQVLEDRIFFYMKSATLTIPMFYMTFLKQLKSVIGICKLSYQTECKLNVKYSI